MARLTNIGWTDSTFNPWTGCQNVSPGCDFCYAETWAARFRHVEWGPHAPRRRSSAAQWREPRLWNRQAPDFFALHRRRRRVFCASLADVFDNQVPPEWRRDLWDVVRETRELVWLILTKRPQNIRKMLPAEWGTGWPHVWFGVSAEDEDHYRQRWPVLAAIPAAVRFVSYEPALAPLGPLDIGVRRLPDWLICGGESGPNRRPFDPQWARDARDACEEHGVAFFHKQNGGLHPMDGGCTLDGREWKDFPRQPQL
jgi:protein gp37